MPAYLRRCAPWLERDELFALQREDPTAWTTADLPLLEYAGYGVLVHPSRSLAAIGRQRGWAILHPERPYDNKLGDMLRVVLQMFGLHPE